VQNNFVRLIILNSYGVRRTYLLSDGCNQLAYRATEMSSMRYIEILYGYCRHY